jgi:hypothetical protein
MNRNWHAELANIDRNELISMIASKDNAMRAAVKQRDEVYARGKAEGLKFAATVLESEILPDHVDPPKDETGWMLRRTATASLTMLASKFRRLATESEGPEHG